MKLIKLFCVLFLLFSLSCASRTEIQDQTSEELNIVPAKPVIGILPVDYGSLDDVSQTLGEAFSQTLNHLLISLQAYDIRPIPEGYSPEELQSRGYDHLITSHVVLQNDGSLNLGSRVLDGRNLKTVVDIEESTQDFLALFTLAEQMVYSMVEEFYGEHLTFSTIQINSPLDHYLFIDGVYRDLDEKGQVKVLSGEHQILVMGEARDKFYLNEILTLSEGEIKEIPLFKRLENIFLFKGSGKKILIDGKVEDWSDISIAFRDTSLKETEPSSLDLEWVKLYSDARNIYILFKRRGNGGSAGRYPQYELHLKDLREEYYFRLRFKQEPPDRDNPFAFKYYDMLNDQKATEVQGRFSWNEDYVELAFPLRGLNPPLDSSITMESQTRDSSGVAGDGRDGDTLQSANNLVITEDPGPALSWINKEWKPGTEKAQYRVPAGFLKIDGRVADWSVISLISQNPEPLDSQDGLDLRSLKTAMDEENLYLLIDSHNEWGRKEPIFMELDTQSGEALTLRLENRKLYLEKDGTSNQIKGTLKYGANYLEAGIPMEEIAELSNLEVSSVKRVYSDSRDLKVIPYY